jgi:hypothetical protein
MGPRWLALIGVSRPTPARVALPARENRLGRHAR